MSKTIAQLLIAANHVAFVADRSNAPKRYEGTPYSPKDLENRPNADISYEEIGQLVAAGLATITEPYGGCSNVVRTYEGQKLFLRHTGWDEEGWRRRFQKYLCCDKAVARHCVCLVAVMCPAHGLYQCHGSHD